MAALTLNSVPIPHGAVHHHTDHDAALEPRDLEWRIIIRLREGGAVVGFDDEDISRSHPVIPAPRFEPDREYFLCERFDSVSLGTAADYAICL